MKLVLLILAALFLIPIPSGFAQAPELPRTLEALVAELPAADFDRKAQIIDALAETGNARALMVIDALANGTLFATAAGTIVIQSAGNAKAYSDALTGTVVPGLSEDQLTKM